VTNRFKRAAARAKAAREDAEMAARRMLEATTADEFADAMSEVCAHALQAAEQVLEAKDDVKTKEDEKWLRKAAGEASKAAFLAAQANEAMKKVAIAAVEGPTETKH
jgi:hypothetical protein